ncbi:MAG: helix-turn-helix domain-containing protein [Magnetococcales bacterium]|nr:helix-turn-helix domain-containing protein [Magnetococcales bacterium]
MRTPMKISLPDNDRKALDKWIRSRSKSISEKQKLRAKIVLHTADRMSTQEMMNQLGVSNPTLNLWRNRYLEKGLEGLIKGKTRKPGTEPLAREKVEEILTLTMTGTPCAATHWSCRSMAKQTGVSKTAVNRIWKAHGLKPHQVRSFKVSNDPKFEEKLRDVIGLYLDPPEKARVFLSLWEEPNSGS